MSAKRAEKRADNRNSIIRVVVGSVLLGIQVWWLVFMILNLEDRFPWVSILVSLIAVMAALVVYCRRMNNAAKIAWMIVIVALPILGVCLYLLMGRRGLTRRKRRLFSEVESYFLKYVSQDPAVFETLDAKSRICANEFRYILNESSMPAYTGTDVQYFSDTTEALDMQIKKLREAKRFIFMEYYAIEDLESFGRIKEVLVEQVNAGVEVRLFYDEIGSVGFLTRQFVREMQALGIDCRLFNPVVPVLNMFMNNRDHRKITVIDGEVGFTGGYNLADEYFHITEPYGYWKDTGIMLTGSAVRSLTVQFLSMWNSISWTDRAPDRYFRVKPYQAAGNAVVQPYGGTPMRHERIAEEVFMNILRGAERYAWFSSPYLVITDEFSRELTAAAKRGVDVRIVVPAIPDKKTVYAETKSFFPQMIRGNVRIYTYTPGFCHAKMCVSDDRMSIVGTINMDYRSLYHHFENAVLIYDEATASEIRKDFEEMYSVSREVTPEDEEAVRKPWRIVQAFLRLVAPLL